MRRFISFAVLLLFGIPLGVSLSGCHKGTVPIYCNGATSGVQVGQLVTLNLEPRLTGISLNQGQIGSIPQPTGADCQAHAVTPSALTYSYTNSNGSSYTSKSTLVDLDQSNGRLCAGVWNRNSGGGVADYTYCTPGAVSGTTYVTATADGVSSNPIPVYVHPVVTSIVLGSSPADCSLDAASNCNLDASKANGCAVGAPPAPRAPAQLFDTNSCVSQGFSAQLVARVYANNKTDAANNISCLVGPLTFTAQNSAVAIAPASSTANGVLTAAQPGSSIINAAAGNSQAASSAGFFSTCPPKSITLTTQGSTLPPTGPITVNQNVNQSLIVTVTDTHNNPINNLTLTYESTQPQTIPAGGTITPLYPGAAAITAICEPLTCNTASFDQIGLLQNGTPIFSNQLNIVANGTNSATVLYIASTNSQYLLPIDFTQPTASAPVRLPYQPTSMVISQDGSAIYIGSTYELMTLSTSSNAITKQDNTVSGNVLSVSPNGTYVVLTDPVRNLIYIYNSTGGIASQYGGTATTAAWSPDSNQVYITTADSRLLVYSSFTGWNPVNLANTSSSVAVTVPSAGAYLGNSYNASTGAQQGAVTARTVCPLTTVIGTGSSTQTANIFYPQADVTAASAASVAATSDGLHILGASPTTGSNTGAFTDVLTNKKAGACTPPPTGTGPVITFTSSTNPAIPFSGGVSPAYITATFPQSPIVQVTSDSAFAFVTFTGTGGVVPQYSPATGVLTNIALQKTAAGTPVAPVAGAISTDNQTFYVGTSGDNLVHQLTRGTAGFLDSGTPINPQLPIFNTPTGFATPNLLVLRPRKSTS